MSRSIIKNIEKLRKLQTGLKKYNNKEKAINYIMNKMNVSEKDGLEIYDFLIGKSDVSSKDKSNNIFSSIIFYCIVILTGIVVFPTLGIIAPVFMISSLICPIGGLLHFICGILNLNIPFISFQIGSVALSPFIGLIVSIVTGIVLYLIGKSCWQLLLIYINQVKKLKANLKIH